jgi:ornithine cyclodeaminase
VLGHIGARGTAYWNVRLLHRVLGLEEVRVHSRRTESRQAFAATLAEDLGIRAVAVDDWHGCVEGCDVVVEASRLERPEPLLRTSWIAPGSFLVPYGTMSAVELSLLDVVDKVVVDDWEQCRQGRFGSLRRHVAEGVLSAERLHGELCELVVGAKAGRETAEETDLLWHRGLALSDIALGELVLRRAEEEGLGTMLRLL